MFSLPEAAAFLQTSLLHPDPSRKPDGISIDTRTLKAGDFFIALRGGQRDGHEFLRTAFERGAAGALVERSYMEEHREEAALAAFHNLLAVPDTRQALTSLAVWHRSRMPAVCIGITGSVGKTTTKEFLRYLLEKIEGSGKVLANEGNFNNELGLPLTLLRLDPVHRYCVCEMGASRPGDIAYLSGLLNPAVGILTCVAPAHLEGFGSLAGVYDTKLELFREMRKGGIAVFPSGDPEIEKRLPLHKLKLTRVGRADGTETGDRKGCFLFSGEESRSGRVRFSAGRFTFEFPSSAVFFAYNAALALAALEQLGISLERIPSIWEDFNLPSGRFTPVKLQNGIEVIYDGYNASPRSFAAALEAFDALSCQGRKVLVFSDMLELGTESENLHRELGRRIAACRLEAVFSYGEKALLAHQEVMAGRKSAEAFHFESREALSEALTKYARAGDCLLLKASRGMKVEAVLEKLKPEAAGNQSAAF